MLLRFGVENHLSIRDRQELTLTAAKRVKRTGPTKPVPILGETAVPVAALYGANASGKSNLIDAVQMMHSHIEKSHKALNAEDTIPRHPFLLDRDSANKPTRFDCLFTVQGQEADASQEVYEYGFSCTDTEYTNEWLHRIVRHKRLTTQTLFHRKTLDGSVQVHIGAHLRGENRSIKLLTRPNSLFLSAAAQNNHPQLGPIHRHFAQQWQRLRGEPQVFKGFPFEDTRAFDGIEHKDAFLELMHQADIGVVGIELKDYPSPFRIVSNNPAERASEDSRPAPPQKRFRFQHAGAEGAYPLDYSLESHGTRQLTALAGPLLSAISAGWLVTLDELDASLHHRLTESLLKLFKSATNQHGAQLVTTVHDTALLRDGLDLDEVWLAEKDSSGASTFTPLTAFRIRSRDDLERVYRDGRVGGAPVIGDLAVALSD